MNDNLDPFAITDYTNPPPPPLMMGAAAPPREKTKRPQLSCNPCRARKVKCDRIQPCTACSLHQIAEICHYDLSEQERQPILQAEALKEKDKAIAHLQQELSLLRGDPIKSEPFDEEFHGHQNQKMRLPPRSLKRSSLHGEQQLPPQDGSDANLYFGQPGVITVADEFAHLSFDKISANLPLTVNRGTDMFPFPMVPSHPFPTLWTAKEDTSTLIKLLPPEEDLFFYIDSFQRRAQAFSFPHLPDECTHAEVQHFLEHLEHHAALHPDMLALLFSTLALGLQDGVYDRCGEKWVSGSVEAESQKGDVYIAAAMQCLRLSSFLNRPTLRAIEALMMMGPYLTNSGKFLDASALFGGTIRLAQSIGLHRDPTQLNPPVPAKEVASRKSLWWWMLHMDQQYSMTLGRPLGISSMGDCPSPEPSIPDPMVQSLSNYMSHFSLLGRQILSSGPLSNPQIDKYSDDLLALQRTIPNAMQFEVSWLHNDNGLPAWPLDAQAGLLHAKTHNLLILLNRQRVENGPRDSTNHRLVRASTNANHISRGRERVLQSCRALLAAFEFFTIRSRAALMCWTMAQMAFNAAMLLTLSMIETGETQDLLPVQQVYSTFLEMNKLGIHKLADAAVDRLGTLMKEFPSEDSADQTVMGQQGMMLLEDPGLPVTSLSEGFTPTTDQRTGDGSHLARKRGGRKPMSSREQKNQQQRAAKKRSSPKSSQRQATDRRFSDSVTPRPQQRRRTNRSTPNLSLMTHHPGQSVFSANSTPTVKNETLFPQTFEGFSNPHPFANSPGQQQQQQQQHPHDLRLNLENIHHPQPQHPHSHHHQQNASSNHHAASDPGNPNNNDFDFSTQTTPYSSEFFDDGLPPGITDHHIHNPFEQAAFSAPPFSLAGDPSGSFAPHF